MCEGSQAAEAKSCAQLQQEYAVLIRVQMGKQQVSIRSLVDEGIIKSSHRNRFFERIAEGSLTYAEINKVTERLGIDPVRAAITVKCFESPDAYEDPSCETTAYVAVSLAVQLFEVMAACDGEFEPLKEGLCEGLAKRATNAIAQNHARVEALREALADEDADRAFG